MVWMRNMWNNFKTQPEIWFFYAFLIFFPFSIRKILLFYPIAGQFNEYTAISIYLSDIFLLAALALWLISILKNIISDLSIVNLFQVSRGTFYLTTPLILLTLWSLASILWSVKPTIATFRSAKVFEFSLLFFFLAANPHCFTWNTRRNSLVIVIALGLINSIIGVFQFILQHSIGLDWLWESQISPNFPGVAKVLFDGSQFIRIYGLFPHPNILGGFLLISILSTMFLRNSIISRSRELRCFQSICSTWNTYRKNNFYSIIFGFILGIQILAGFLTFSKSAILALIFSLLYYSLWLRVSRETLWALIRRWRWVIALLGIIVIFALFSAKFDYNTFFLKSWWERLLLLWVAKNMIVGNFLTGVGMGQFVPEMQSYVSQSLSSWQFQPVHNVFLIILSELGLVGISLSIWFLSRLVRNRHPSKGSGLFCFTWNKQKCEIYNRVKKEIVSRGTNSKMRDTYPLFMAFLIGFLVITLFDHYLWDIQQGQFMLWLVFGLLPGEKNNLTYI